VYVKRDHVNDVIILENSIVEILYKLKRTFLPVSIFVSLHLYGFDTSSFDIGDEVVLNED